MKRVRTKIREVVAEITDPTKNARADNVEILGNLQSQMKETEDRLARTRREIECLGSAAVDESDLAHALSSFDPIWDELTPGERIKIIRLIVERVGYDGRTGDVLVDFHSEGLRSLCRGEGAIQGDDAELPEPLEAMA